ncbi:MAG: carbohydrate ABC transporter permease [Caldilinea sp.]
MLIALPALMTFALAFMRYDALTPPVWNGVGNFTAIFHRDVFWIVVRNTLIFALSAAPLQALGALGLALLLHPQRRGAAIYRSIVYLSSVLPDVAYALIWLWLLNPLYGPVNLALAWAGLPTPAWLVDPHTALGALVLVAAVRVGEGMLLLIAARRTVPSSLFDAATIDGAGAWQSFYTITLPLLTPWLLLLLIRDLAMAVHSSFTPVYIMTGGGPGYATTLLPFLIYEAAFTHLRIGQASAMMAVMFAIVGLLVWMVSMLMRRWRVFDAL